MSDPTAMPGQEPSPEELRAYLEQLRGAEAAGLLAEAYNLLAAGAQVKLGRSDARPLIDAMAGIAAAVGDRVPAELAAQMRDGVAQLQTAQVQAERQTAAEGEGTGDASAREPDAVPPPGGPARPETGVAGAQRQGSGQRMTDRLWIPGRPGPPPG
ncbi:MAG: hypothetical protein H0V19_02120 [Euzebyales bacterium]|nr:hypothetical protein [Euzebyales bacterium]